MKELKEYLAPSLTVIEIGDYVFTKDSSESNKQDDPYGGSGGWWENP